MSWMHFWIPLLVNALIAWPVYRLLLGMRARQTIDPYAPEAHKAKQGTPTMGGLMILPGLVGVLATSQLHPSAAALVIVFGLIGFVDDFVVPRLMAGKRGLGWKQKLLLEMVLGGGCLLLSPPFQRDPVWLWIGLFFVLFFSNAFNFADGLDALAGSLMLAMGIGFAALGLGSDIGIAGLAMAGAVIPFLFFNAPPAKVFMGDVGSLGIGALIGWLNTMLLMGAWNGGRGWPMFGILFVFNFVLILELVLVPIQVAFYKRTKRRIFPATPIHHAFEVKGIPERRVVWWFFLVQSLCIALALTLAAGWASRGPNVGWPTIPLSTPAGQERPNWH